MIFLGVRRPSQPADVPTLESSRRPSQVPEPLTISSVQRASTRSTSPMPQIATQPELSEHEQPFGVPPSMRSSSRLPVLDEHRERPPATTRRVEGVDSDFNVRARRRVSVFPMPETEQYSEGQRNKFRQEKEDVMNDLKTMFPETSEGEIKKAVQAMKSPPEGQELTKAEEQNNFDLALRNLVDSINRKKGGVRTTTVTLIYAVVVVVTDAFFLSLWFYQDPAIQTARRIAERQGIYNRSFADMGDVSPRDLSPLLQQKPCVIDGTLIEPTGKKKALLIGCSYSNLGSPDALTRPVKPEIQTVRTALVETLGFPSNNRCMTLLAADEIDGFVTDVPFKKDILKVSRCKYEPGIWLDIGTVVFTLGLNAGTKLAI